MNLSKVRENARQDILRKLDDTGLNYIDIRGGFLVSSFGNDGQDIKAVLEEAGLDIEFNAGSYLVSCYKAEQTAIRQAYEPS